MYDRISRRSEDFQILVVTAGCGQPVPRHSSYEMELKGCNVQHARNLFDCAVTLLPHVDQLWYKYAYLEELLQNIPGARQVFERWMQGNQTTGHGRRTSSSSNATRSSTAPVPSTSDGSPSGLSQGDCCMQDPWDEGRKRPSELPALCYVMATVEEFRAARSDASSACPRVLFPAPAPRYEYSNIGRHVLLLDEHKQPMQPRYERNSPKSAKVVSDEDNGEPSSRGGPAANGHPVGCSYGVAPWSVAKAAAQSAADNAAQTAPGYIQLEFDLRKFDRVRELYQKYIEYDPTNSAA
ncbi:hypothetical protein OH76DRAFT_1490141 [Lentinus brumalis]|uniref:Suppressor of forked domain-containing protein n=1 Tax=Lentinus brumalis TaxID=2498619 RepID=A0A371CK06_9APHY|nr:hypothetical protein OH76DRAFT_1490141 [Polyporus brumalis]